MRTSVTGVLLSLVALLTGCSLTSASIQPAVISPALRGMVRGGQQPISGSTVTVYQMGTSGYGSGAQALASTVTDSNGNFSFASGAYTCPYSNTPVYLLSVGGDPGGGTNANVVLAAGLGACSAAKTVAVNVNEVTTAVTAFALSHFFTTTYGGNSTTDLFGGTAAGAGVYNAGLVMANSYTIPTLVNLATGTVNTSTATMTIESAKIYSIANALAACVNSTGLTGTTDTASNCGKLFSDTAPASGARPADTLQAAVSMAMYPYQNVAGIYNLASTSPPFVGLSAAPNDWTVGVSYTSASYGLGLYGTQGTTSSSNIDIDAAGRVWFPSTVQDSSGNAGVAYFDPTGLTFNGPYGRLNHSQYLAIDRTGTVFGTDLAADFMVSMPAANPAQLTFYIVNPAGLSYTGPIAAAYGDGTSDSMVFIAGGTNYSLGYALYQELEGSISQDAFYNGLPNGLATYGYGVGAAVDTMASGTSLCRYESESSSGTITVRSSTLHSPCYVGGIANVYRAYDTVGASTSTNQLCIYGATTPSCFAPSVGLSAPEGVAVDGDSNIWVANSGNASVSTLGYNTTNPAGTAADYLTTSPIQYLHGATAGNTITTPYGIAIDRSGNVWISNAGCISTTSTPTSPGGIVPECTPTAFVLSELIGAAAPTLTPLSQSTVPEIEGTRPD